MCEKENDGMGRRLRCGVVLGALAVPVTAQAEITVEQGYQSAGEPEKGIVLHLHDCHGLIPTGWIDAWFGHFERSGYKVYAPDSFAQKRRRRACSWPYPALESIYRLREAQTGRALAVIRKDHPGMPVYVWGHGEGAWLASRLKSDLAGVVTTGAICGYGRRGAVSLKEDIPVLALVGDPRADRLLRRELRYKRRKSVAGVCSAPFAADNRTWQSEEGAGQIAGPWDPRVRAAVNTVIPIRQDYAGVLPEENKAGAAGLRIGTAGRREFRRDYLRSAPRKAFAIGPFGYYGFSTDWGSDRDAAIDALYRCNRVLQRNVTTGRRQCAIYALNDSIRLRGPARETIRAVQTQLRELGFRPGPADGIWGRRTRAALNELRARHNLPPVDRYGKSSASLLERLGRGARQ